MLLSACSLADKERRNNVKNLANLEGQRVVLKSGQSYRYDYDSTAYANVD